MKKPKRIRVIDRMEPTAVRIVRDEKNYRYILRLEGRILKWHWERPGR